MLRLKVLIHQAEAREYPRKSDGRLTVAHSVSVLVPDGPMGEIYLGGDTAAAKALFQKAHAATGQMAEIVYSPRTYQGKVDLSPVDVVAVK